MGRRDLSGVPVGTKPLNIIYELAAFVIADGIGANLERADIIGRLGHGAFLIVVAVACAASIGLRSRKDAKPVRRILSALIFGAVSAAYAFGLTLLEHEPQVAALLLALMSAAGAGASIVVSQAVAGFRK